MVPSEIPIAREFLAGVPVQFHGILWQVRLRNRLTFRHVITLSPLARPALVDVLGGLLTRMKGIPFGHATLETFDDLLHTVDNLENLFGLNWLRAHRESARAQTSVHLAEQHIGKLNRAYERLGETLANYMRDLNF